MFRFCHGPNTCEEARTKDVAGVRKYRRDANRTGFHIYLPICQQKIALVGVERSVAEGQLELVVPLLCSVLVGFANFLCRSQIFLFTNGKVHADRIDGRYGGKSAGRWADEVPDLSLRNPGDPVNRSFDSRKAQVQLSLFYLRSG